MMLHTKYKGTIPTDIPIALKRDCIYNIDMLFSKKGFQAFIYIYFKALTYTDVPARLTHF